MTMSQKSEFSDDKLSSEIIENGCIFPATKQQPLKVYGEHSALRADHHLVITRFVKFIIIIFLWMGTHNGHIQVLHILKSVSPKEKEAEGNDKYIILKIFFPDVL